MPQTLEQEREPYIDNHEFVVRQQLKTLAERLKRNFPGTSYAIFYNHATHHLEPAPPQVIISSPFSHAIDYASGCFEGISAHVNERTGIPQVILLEPRTKRMFTRSIPNSGFKSPIGANEFQQAVVDFVAINGYEYQLFRNPKQNSELARAYVRPSIHPAALGGYGVWLPAGYPVDATFITWPWPDYLDPKMYTKGGEVAITGKQRLSFITGKHSRNYGEAVVDSKEAREQFGANEFVYLAPYLVDENGSRFWTNPRNSQMKLKYGALADGPGEEVIALKKDQKTLIYPPIEVNRLGGTTLEYIKDYLAPRFGIKTQEGDITLADLRADKYVALAMIGNAVRVAPIRLIRILDTACDSEEVLQEEIELFSPGNIPEPLRALMRRYEDEINGRVDPSHPSLLTPVDMERGQLLREQLDARFAQKATHALDI